MSAKVRVELTHYELQVVRSLLGKTNDTVGVGELFNKVADKCDLLELKKVELKFETYNGITYAIGKE